MQKIAIIRNITGDISSSYGANPKSTFLSDVSNIRIRSISENSNTKIKNSETLTLAQIYTHRNVKKDISETDGVPTIPTLLFILTF